MTTANETRREVMVLAWRKFRYEQGRAGYTFAEALAHAWTWIKGAAVRAAAELAWAAQPARIVHLRSAVRSPIARTLAGQRYGRTRDFKAAYTTARVGY